MKKQRYYNGEAPCSKQTSINGAVSPAIKWLFAQNKIKPNDIVMDFGCGKIARNAEWLSEQGIRVHRYDPYWGKVDNADCGWKKGRISGEVTSFRNFDVVFTSYVLNTVTKSVQDEIVNKCRELGGAQYHIVRNDVTTAAVKGLQNPKSVVMNFFIDNYKGTGTVEDFARFGFATSRGFQRQTNDEDMPGFKMIKKTANYRVYTIW